MKQVKSSTTGKAFDNLESSWLGMSQGKMALLFAVLMSLTPLIVALLDGAEQFLREVPNTKDGRAGSVKKQKPHLTAVA